MHRFEIALCTFFTGLRNRLRNPGSPAPPGRYAPLTGISHKFRKEK